MKKIERIIEELELEIEVEKIMKDYVKPTILYTAIQMQESMRISRSEFGWLKQQKLFIPIKKGMEVLYNPDNIYKYYDSLERQSLLKNMSYDDLYYRNF